MSSKLYPQGTFDAHVYGGATDDELLGIKRTRPETIEDFWSVAKGELEPSRTAGVGRVSKVEFIKFVTNYCDGKIFTSADLRRNEDVGLVFLPAVMGAFADWTEEALKTVGVLYEDYSKALPRGINGYPMFTSMRVMHAEDWKKAKRAIQRELALRQGTARRVEEDFEDVDSDSDSTAAREYVRDAGERSGADAGEERHVGGKPSR